MAGIPVYSVGQISAYIKNIFSRDFLLRNICIKGEVSNLKYHSSGHVYFTLKDTAGTLNCVLFAGNRNGLSFVMQNGQQVQAYGNVSVYEKDGRYLLYCRRIEQTGLGDLYFEFEKRKKALEEMGMFDAGYKKPIPEYCFRIGIVTASTGAAIQDIVNIAHRRNPYVQLILYPAFVQGQYAAASIVHGIETLDAMHLDCLIVGRGGGSIEDLWAFNEESVARAIFDCETPVISAVGHETDTTIADYTADLRAPTPSAAAELAVFDLKVFQQKLEDRQVRLQHKMQQKIHFNQLRLEGYRLRIGKSDPESSLDRKKDRLASYQKELQIVISRRIRADRDKLDTAKERMSRQMNQAVGQTEEQTKYIQNELRKNMLLRLQKEKHRMQLSAVRLENASPLAHITKGYVYAETKEKKALSSIRQAEPGDPVQIYLQDGIIETEVKEVSDQIWIK